MKPLADLLADIQDAQEQMLGTMPFRDFGAPARLGASETALATAEQRIGRALPPSYRAFLRLHDGWSRFYDGAALLGTATLGLRQYDDLARATFDAAETPVPDVGPPSRFKPRVLIPFGIDVQAMTLFVFNPAVCDESGEYEVIAWINELGIRRSSFPSFLEMIGELCDAELASDAQSRLTL